MNFSTLALSIVASFAITSSPVSASLRGANKGNGADKATVIITLGRDKQTGPGNRCDALARANGGTVGHVFTKVMNGCSMELPRRAIEALSKSPGVEAIEEDQVMSVDQALPWGLDRIDQCDLPLSNSSTKMDASGVRVYILDTGIKGDHTEFTGMFGPASCQADLVNEGDALVDGHGHGTHVAGTTCGANYGVSENCELCAVKVLDSTGFNYGNSVIAGLEHVANSCEAGATCVANMSLGGGFSSALNSAVASVVDQGITVVVSAGNHGGSACTKSPASEPKAITVGSTTSSDTMSSFSGHGPCADVFAPGSSILSAGIVDENDTATASGTSMASPHVAGIAASILSADSSLSPAAVAAKLKDDAKLLGLDPMGEPIRLTNTVVDGCAGPTFSPTTPPPTVSPTSAPTFSPCPENESRLTVDIKTDNYPYETTWTLVNNCDDSELLSGGPYTSAGTLYSQTTSLCLPDDAEYVFTINDSYGDGICCSVGSGEYVVKQDGVQVLSGGDFGTREVASFGTCGSTPTPITPPPVSSPPNSPPSTSPPSPFPTYQSTTSPPTNNPTPNPTNAPTDAPTIPPTTSPTYFTCNMFNEAACPDAYGGGQCQWIGSCKNCGCVPTYRD